MPLPPTTAEVSVATTTEGVLTTREVIITEEGTVSSVETQTGGERYASKATTLAFMILARGGRQTGTILEPITSSSMAGIPHLILSPPHLGVVHTS